MARKITKPPQQPPPPPKTAADDVKEQIILEVLAYPVLLTDQIRDAVMEADSFKSECSSLAMVVETVGIGLRSINRIAINASPGSLYERPIRRIVADVTRVLEKTLILVRKCRRSSIIRRLMTIVSAADFKKLQTLVESSKADMSWLLNIFDGAGGITLSLPPFASNDPIIGWVWGPIASLYMGQISDKTEAANQLASLAKDNDRNKKYILEEGGIPPLLKLLKENSSIDVQIAAAIALVFLANDEERVCAIVNDLGVPIIVKVLGDSPMKVQITLANLVAKMAQHSSLAKEAFARENVIRPLVTLLSIDIVDESSSNVGKQSFDAIVEIKKEREKNQLNRPGFGSSLSMQSTNGSSRGGHHKKERENEPLEVKVRLKTSCAEALWKLARGSVLNSRKITETKGLLCLAKLIEKEEGELVLNCLMTIEEITAAAELNVDLRRATFKTNSSAAKAVVDQLLRIIKEYDNNPRMLIPAIRAIGSLARTFPARETRVIAPLVGQLGQWNLDLATEAAIALGKFAGPENFLCLEHSRSIIEFRGVQLLQRLVLAKGNERAQYHGLVLLCYLILHVRNSEHLQEGWVSNTLDKAVNQHPELRELINDARGHLTVYHSGILQPR